MRRESGTAERSSAKRALIGRSHRYRPTSTTPSASDPERRRLYVAIGEPGVVCSFDSDQLTALETVETEPGAPPTARHLAIRLLPRLFKTLGRSS